MIYLIGGVVLVFAFCLFKLSLNAKTIKKQEAMIQDLETLNAQQKLMLERIRQREKIEQGNTALTDTELDERLQGDYRD